MSRDTYTLAVAQPRTAPPPDESPNVAHAVELIEQAAQAGAEFVLFPEGYPGPWRSECGAFDAAEEISAAAVKSTIAVCWARNELCTDGKIRLVVYVTDKDGSAVLRYERAHPATLDPAESGGRIISPGPQLGYFEMDGVPFGIVVCSELWIPETTRVLALRGAEIILSPAGGGFTSLTRNWGLIAEVRAIENHAYVALTNNLYGTEQGAAMITGPEHPLALAGRGELAVAPLDLARARWLRDRDDSLAEPKSFDSIPGLLRARRPELYGELSAPRADSFDYERGRA